MRSRTFIGLLLMALTAFQASVLGAAVEFRDDFSSAELAAGWSFVREDASAHSLTDRPGFLRIDTQRGAGSNGGPIRNLLLRPQSGDFILETRLEFNPERAQQFAGLAVYADDANNVALGLVYAAGDRGIFRGIALLGVTDGQAASTRPGAFYDAESSENPNIVYLRLLRSGDQFVAGYSPDGVTYTDIGSVTNALPDDVQVGLAAANGDFEGCGDDCDVSIPADFDYFQISTFSGSDGGTGGVTLESIELEGADEVDGGDSAEYTVTANFSDGTSVEVTGEALWTIAPAELGSIDAGAFEASDVAATSQVTLVASYTQLSSGGAMTRTDSLLIRITPPTSGPNGPRACGAAMLPITFLISLAWLDRRMKRPRNNRNS